MKRLVLKLIDFYQKNISPNTGKKCRYLPTCSEYAKICFTRFNFFYASFLSIKRILKCNPLFPMKYDPVPEKKGFGIDPIAINLYLKIDSIDWVFFYAILTIWISAPASGSSI